MIISFNSSGVTVSPIREKREKKSQWFGIKDIWGRGGGATYRIQQWHVPDLEKWSDHLYRHPTRQILWKHLLLRWFRIANKRTVSDIVPMERGILTRVITVKKSSKSNLPLPFELAEAILFQSKDVWVCYMTRQDTLPDGPVLLGSLGPWLCGRFQPMSMHSCHVHGCTSRSILAAGWFQRRW